MVTAVLSTTCTFIFHGQEEVRALRFAQGHRGIKPVTFTLSVVVSNHTGMLTPTSLISSLQTCLKRIGEYLIYIFMSRADP